MGITVFVTRDFEHMSLVAADIVGDAITRVFKKKYQPLFLDPRVFA